MPAQWILVFAQELSDMVLAGEVCAERQWQDYVMGQLAVSKITSNIEDLKPAFNGNR